MKVRIFEDEHRNAFDEPEAHIWIWIINTLLMNGLNDKINITCNFNVFLNDLFNICIYLIALVYLCLIKRTRAFSLWF